MKRFIIIKRSASGCDYSQECGTGVEYISAESAEAVIEKIFGFDEKELRQEITDCIEEYGERWEGSVGDYIRENMIHNWDDDPYSSYEVIELVPDSDMELLPEFDIRDQKAESILSEYRNKHNNDQEKAEYERLKKKFG